MLVFKFIECLDEWWIYYESDVPILQKLAIQWFVYVFYNLMIYVCKKNIIVYLVSLLLLFTYY